MTFTAELRRLMTHLQQARNKAVVIVNAATTLKGKRGNLMDSSSKGGVEVGDRGPKIKIATEASTPPILRKARNVKGKTLNLCQFIVKGNDSRSSRQEGKWETEDKNEG